MLGSNASQKLELLGALRSRLHILEIRSAIQGITTDPATLIEIDQIRSEAEQLEQEITTQNPTSLSGNIVRDLNNLINEVIHYSENTLQENQQIIVSFLNNPSDKHTAYQSINSLFENQRNITRFTRWLSIIDEALQEDSFSIAHEILINFSNQIIDLRSTLYNYDDELLARTNKHSLVVALRRNDIDEQQLEIIMRNYLRNLRSRVESIAGTAYRLSRVLRRINNLPRTN